MKLLKLLGLSLALLNFQACLFDDEEDDKKSSSSELSSSTESSSSKEGLSSDDKKSSETKTSSSSEIGESSEEASSATSSSSEEQVVGCTDGSDEKTNFPLVYTGTSSDWSSVALYSLDADLKRTELELSLSKDSRVVAINKTQVIVLERGADNILLYDLAEQKVVYQKNLIAGTDVNPYDVAVLPNCNLLIPDFELDKVLEVETATGKILKEIDLSIYNYDDVRARPNDVLVADGKAYVSLQMLNASWKASPSVLVELDAQTLAIIDTFQTSGTNPYKMDLKEGSMYVAYKGNTDYDANWNATSRGDGTLQKIDLSTKAQEVLFTEGTAGGKPIEILFTKSQAYVTILKSSSEAPLYKWNMEAQLTQVEGIQLNDAGLVYSADYDVVFAGDRSFGAEKLYIYDGSSLSNVDLKDGLPPSSISAP